MIAVDLAQTVGTRLQERQLTVSVAESCTGGLMGDLLTSVSGSSAYFLGGVIAYSDRVKVGLLGVPRKMLRAHGAVSQEVAGAMAEGARRLFGSDFALAVTGIAGPTGGTAEKPVGLVLVGLCGPSGTRVERHQFEGDRSQVKLQSAQAALALLLRELDAV